MFRRMPRTIVRCIALSSLFASIATHAQSPALTPLTLQLDWKPTAQFAGVLAAEQQGYYRAEGLAITLRSYDGTGIASVDAVSKHPDWVGVTEADQLLAADARGAHLKAFATIMQSTPFALLTLKDSGLTSIKSLQGKTIGLHDDGEKALDVLLQFNGMTRADVKTKAIGYEFDSLLTGNVDAMQGYTNDEVVRLEMERHPVNIIPMSANGYVAYAEVLFANADYIQTHPDTLAKLIRAMARGWQYAQQHPDETAHMIVANYAPDSSYAEQRASLDQTLKLLYTESPRFGEMRMTTWRDSIQMFEKYKLVDGTINLSDVVDDEISKRPRPY